MIYFLPLLKVLFLLTTLFYVVFFGFIYYWHEKLMTCVVVPLIFSFEFFIIGFFVATAAAILLEYAPKLF